MTLVGPGGAGKTRVALQLAALLIDEALVEAGPAASFFAQPRDPRTAAFCQGRMVY